MSKELEKRKHDVEVIDALVADEKVLRDKHGMGDKYRSIANRIKALQEKACRALDASKGEVVEEAVVQQGVSEDEQLVYVHLFNARGQKVSQWEPMLTQRSLYEYGVNRPVYGELKDVLSYINSRSSALSNACLAVRVRKDDVVDTNVQQDALGHSLLKIKEGALLLKNVVSFTHGDDVYSLKKGHLELSLE